MRFYYRAADPAPLARLEVAVADAVFCYGFEYQGVADRLVQTPLTDRAYLTLTQALRARMGGSPFGPAGTGKTETVKALAAHLGRLVLVFNCDEAFDLQVPRKSPAKGPECRKRALLKSPGAAKEPY